MHTGIWPLESNWQRLALDLPAVTVVLNLPEIIHAWNHSHTSYEQCILNEDQIQGLSASQEHLDLAGVGEACPMHLIHSI